MKHIKGLDALRAFAVIFVLIDHWGPLGYIQQFLIPNGTSGVNFFFVLSGFLITSILLKARKGSYSRSVIIKNFIIRRALRIFPVYYLCLLFLYLINYPDMRVDIGYYLGYASNIMMFRDAAWSSFPVTWSLAVEEQFYIIWPFVIVLIAKKYIKNVLLFTIVLGLASSFAILHLFNGFDDILTISCLNAFGIGALFAFARRSKRNLKKFQTVLYYMLPVALVVYAFGKVAPYISGIDNLGFMARTIDSIIAVGVINLVIYSRSKWVAMVTGNKMLNYIGVVSYGIYLYHYPLGYLYDFYSQSFFAAHPVWPAWLNSFEVAYIIKLSLLFTLSHLSYHYIERPILGLKARFEYANKPKPVQPSVIQSTVSGFHDKKVSPVNYDPYAGHEDVIKG